MNRFRILLALALLALSLAAGAVRARAGEGTRAPAAIVGRSVALLVDSSGSMADNDPTDLRVEAARVFIELTRVGDKIAIVDFDGDATILAPLQTIESDLDRADLRAATAAIDSGGATDLNDALNAGFSQLQSDAGDNVKVAILLTDGEHGGAADVPPYDDNSHLQYQAAGWPVYTVALGDGADVNLLGEIAGVTGGGFYLLGNASDMHAIYAQISALLSGGSSLMSGSALLATGETAGFAAHVPLQQEETTFFSGWAGSTASLSLTTPGGEAITATTERPGVRHAKGATYEIYVVTNPEAGLWQLHVFGDNLAPEGELVSVRAFTVGQSWHYLPVMPRAGP